MKGMKDERALIQVIYLQQLGREDIDPILKTFVILFLVIKPQVSGCTYVPRSLRERSQGWAM